MSQRVRKNSVRLTTATPIQLDGELVLPPGSYTGVRQEIGVARYSGVRWTEPEYKIEFTNPELEAMGMEDAGRTSSIEIPVTRFVRSGQLTES